MKARCLTVSTLIPFYPVVASLQQNLVDMINRGDDDPQAAVDSLGIRTADKRKRVQEVQVPLPALTTRIRNGALRVSPGCWVVRDRALCIWSS